MAIFLLVPALRSLGEAVDPGRSFPKALLSPSAPQFGGILPRHQNKKHHKGTFYFGGPGENRTPSFSLQTRCVATIPRALVQCLSLGELYLTSKISTLTILFPA